MLWLRPVTGETHEGHSEGDDEYRGDDGDQDLRPAKSAFPTITETAGYFSFDSGHQFLPLY